MSFVPPRSPADSEALDVRAYLRPLWRRRYLVIAIVVLAGVITYLYSNSRTKQYQATTALYIQVANPAATLTASTSALALEGPTTNQLDDISQLVISAQIRTLVEHQLGVRVASVGSVTSLPATSSDFIVLTATSRSPVMAARIANDFAQQYLAYRRSSLIAEARDARAAAQTTLAQTPSQSGNLTALAARQTLESTIQQYEQTILDPQIGASQPVRAAAPHFPSSPKPKRDAVFGVAIGILLAIVVAYGLELLNTLLTSPEELERAFRRPVLAVLPKVASPAPFSAAVPEIPDPFKESLRMLRFQLRLNPASGLEPRTILVTSGVQGEGKSTVVRSLALTYALSGQRTLVIDADLRRPSVARGFDVQPRYSMDDVLVGDIELEDAVTRIPVPLAGGTTAERISGAELGSLDILVPGPHASGSIDVLGSQLMHDLLKHAAASYDIVLIDTAPLLLVADSSPLLPEVDSLIVVARLGTVTKHQAQRLNELIERLGDVNFTGVIANHLDGGEAQGYGYGYGYGYKNAGSQILGSGGPLKESDVGTDGRHMSQSTSREL